MDQLCKETTALNIINKNVEINSISSFNYEQLKLLSESEPEQMFLSLSNNSENISNTFVDVTAMINITNLFSKIKLLKSSKLKTIALDTIHNSKYLEHLNNYFKDVANFKDINGNKLEEFFNNCKIVLKHVVNPESKELLNEIITSIQPIESNLMIKHNLETEEITQLLTDYRTNKYVKYIQHPLNSHNPIPVFPVINDIISTTIYLSPNIIKGNYKNVRHYVNVQFHLLRQDFLSMLRNSIQCYKALQQYNTNVKIIPNVHIYNNVQIIRIINNNTLSILCIAKFETEEDCSSDSKNFMLGSLLVFSDNHFNSMFFGTVYRMGRNELPSKSLKFQLLCDDFPIKTNSLYTMFEYDIYFLPYMCAMQALNTFNCINFPMMSYILYGKTVPQKIAYMKNKSLIYNNNGLKFNILNDDFGSDNTLLGFDSSQCIAFKAALTTQFCIIQGPPGTGKTYIGLQIVKTIIENMYITNILKNPIMVISSKNYSLDQFLEGLINITDKIVRIGRRCNSNILQSKILRSITSSSALEVLENSYVVGLTITEASKRHHILEKCPIVIVEEAADVLEPYLVASLTTYCKHLILIGDHKQLRPRTASIILANKFNFDVSLFERMVINKFPYYTLSTQYRMRPTISALLRPIYPNLKNHKLVKKRSDILGVTKNVYFINHENREEESGFDKKSYKNIHEVNFLMEFARYLLKQGYHQNQITILVAYKEQLLEFEKIQSASVDLEDLQIKCIDSYQGKENDIILLSLVRNNIENKIGFLSTPNRVCVALSRARNGLYIMGNMENLMHSNLWQQINEILVNQDSIGNELTLCCKIHTDYTKTVCDSSDFIKAQCLRSCNIKMDCGHCTNLCHLYIDKSH